MPEYTEIKMEWRYFGPEHFPEWRQEWCLFADDALIAKVTKYAPEFMVRHNIEEPTFCWHRNYPDVLPWMKLDREIDRDAFFELSDRGIVSVDMEDIYTPFDAVMIKRDADGSIKRMPDWIIDA